jgi:hypothetical protein
MSFSWKHCVLSLFLLLLPVTLLLPALRDASAEEIDVEDLSLEKWTGAVSRAMEGMRLVQGPMTKEQTADFELKWSPMFDFPCKEVVDWLNKLNPLLNEFLALRAQMAQVAQEFDAAWLEATTAAAYKYEAGIREALAIANQRKEALEELGSRMAAVVKDIQALGDPPNASAAKRRTKKKHDDVIKQTKKIAKGEDTDDGASYGCYVLVKRTNVDQTFAKNRKVSFGKNSAESEEIDTLVSESGNTRANAKFKHTWTEPPERIRPWVYDHSKGLNTTPLQKGESIEFTVTVEDAGSDVAYSEADYPNGWSGTTPGTVSGVTGIDFEGTNTMARAWKSAYKPEDKQLSDKKSTSFNLQVALPVQEDDIEKTMIINFNCGQVHYVYVWDPSGTKVQPMSQQAEADAASADAAAKAEQEKMLEESIAEHQACIEIIKRNMEADRRELATATGSRREDLVRRLMYADSEISHEQDLIISMRTGEYVHTRTALDEATHARFVENCQKGLDELAQKQRLRDGMQRMASKAGEDADMMREFIYRNADAKSDLTKLKKVAAAVYDKVQGEIEAKAAKEEEAAVDADWNLAYVQSVKTTCDRSMMALALGGGHSVMAAYQGATGFIEGPPPDPKNPDNPTDPTLGGRVLEGVKRGLEWYNTATYVAAEAIRGYEEGGYIGGDENKHSVWGSIERAGEAFLMMKAMEYGVGKIFGRPPTGGGGPKKPTVKEQFELAKYKQAVEDGKSLVDDYGRAYKEYQRVLEFGGSAAEIQKIEAELRRKAASMHSTMESKMYLKEIGASGKNAEMVQDYIQRVGQNQESAVAEWKKLMANRGYEDVNAWKLQEFRNASSAGSVGMDHDMGILTDRVFTKNGVRVSAPTMNEDAQKIWNEAYRKVTGYSAERSWETITTGFNKEAYRDMAWLGDDLCKKAKVGDLVGAWAGQAADVTAIKAADLLKDPKFSRLQGLVEASRGTAKDIETKLVPVLEQALKKFKKGSPDFQRVAGYIEHWSNVRDIMKSAGKNPINAERLMNIHTGKNIPEVINDMRDVMASFGKGVGK